MIFVIDGAIVKTNCYSLHGRLPIFGGEFSDMGGNQSSANDVYDPGAHQNVPASPVTHAATRVSLTQQDLDKIRKLFTQVNATQATSSSFPLLTQVRMLLQIVYLHPILCHRLHSGASDNMTNDWYVLFSDRTLFPLAKAKFAWLIVLFPLLWGLYVFL